MNIYQTIGSIIKVCLGLLGLASVIGIFVGIPLGIVFLNKRVPRKNKIQPEKANSIIPLELNKWSWGAFVFTWIWGVGNSVWTSFLVFIPIFGIFYRFYLGFKGREMAWEKSQWRNADEFKRMQDKWDFWAKILFAAIPVSFIVISMLLAFTVRTDNNGATTYNDTPEQSFYNFNASDKGFKIQFPNVPSRKDAISETSDNIQVKQTTFDSSYKNSRYFVFIDEYPQPTFDESNSDLNPDLMLQNKLDGMTQANSNTILVNSYKTVFQGKSALVFKIQSNGETLDGISIYSKSRIITLMADYLKDTSPPLSIEQFQSTLILQ